VSRGVCGRAHGFADCRLISSFAAIADGRYCTVNSRAPRRYALQSMRASGLRIPRCTRQDYKRLTHGRKRSAFATTLSEGGQAEIIRRAGKNIISRIESSATAVSTAIADAVIGRSQ
jgi:hypothetical protein